VIEIDEMCHTSLKMVKLLNQVIIPQSGDKQFTISDNHQIGW